MSAEPFAQQLSRYRRDSTVKAVVIRMESPGGDPMASDVLARELELMRAVKPLLFYGRCRSFRRLLVSSSASEIFAEPFSMTGSIGVYSLYFNVEDALNRLLDIHPQAIHTHPYGNIYSFYHKKSPAALQIIQHSVNQTYDQFVETVSKNRGLSLSETEALADGRIWSGAEALEHKLVDHLGGMTQAVERAAQLAGLTQYRLTAYPKPLKISELIGLAGNTERIKAKSILDPIRDAVVSTLLKERGVRARLPFDEKALLW